jgi:hypothetical protein
MRGKGLCLPKVSFVSQDIPTSLPHPSDPTDPTDPTDSPETIDPFEYLMYLTTYPRCLPGFCNPAHLLLRAPEHQSREKLSGEGTYNVGAPMSSLAFFAVKTVVVL